MTRFNIAVLASAFALLFAAPAEAIKIEIILDNDELYSAAKRAFHEGQLEDAASLYAAAIKRNALSDPETVVAHSDLCVTFLFLERFSEAIAECETALALMPNRWETLNNLGTVYLVQGDFDTALATFERALSMKPGSRILKANKQLTIRRALKAADAPAGKDKGTESPKGASGAAF